VDASLSGANVMEALASAAAGRPKTNAAVHAVRRLQYAARSRSRRLGAATRLQAAWRRRTSRSEFDRHRSAAVNLQRTSRGLRARVFRQKALHGAAAIRSALSCTPLAGVDAAAAALRLALDAYSSSQPKQPPGEVTRSVATQTSESTCRTAAALEQLSGTAGDTSVQGAANSAGTREQTPTVGGAESAALLKLLLSSASPTNAAIVAAAWNFGGVIDSDEGNAGDIVAARTVVRLMAERLEEAEAQVQQAEAKCVDYVERFARQSTEVDTLTDAVHNLILEQKASSENSQHRGKHASPASQGSLWRL
jgi:hypothetical protein